MISRERLVTTGITTAAAATVALVIWLKPWATENIASEQPEPTATQPAGKPGHMVDIVFAVDTTGSMGGLLDGAKRTVWSIANQVNALDKDADLHVGLVAYRDLGDEYVTKDFALTADLDGMYQELTSYQASGGGDVPENVDAALYDAVHNMKWRKGAKKIIFLVGDAPPASRGEVAKFEQTAKLAAKQQIVINTIRCGQDGETATAWQQIAMLGNGAFSTIEQNGGVQQIATPYDDKMAQLAAEIDSTTIIYGSADQRRRYAEKTAAVTSAAPAAAKADRGAYYAKKGGVAAAPAEDVVGGVASGAMNLDDLDEGGLPEEMQNKSKEDLKKDLEARAAKRSQAQKEIEELAKKRDEYIKANQKDGEVGFDAVVKQTLETQLK
ncbi:MAG TPA: vWA domain-containing protein [Kofleriaceae bacterium]|nr:vWA domain-containing protein [Kofleriaceae bacterium]